MPSTRKILPVVLLLIAQHLAAAELIVDVDCAGPGKPIRPTYLGAHLQTNTPSPDRDEFAKRRFSSHGLTDGALTRVFLPGHGKNTWWSHIQSSVQERGGKEDAPYRYAINDFWEILDSAEQLDCTMLVIAPGFPNQTKEVTLAAVAFCNGDPADTRPIGVDADGVDWHTIGYWAGVRAQGDDRHPAHPKPYGVRYWEIGNELYNPAVGWTPDWLKLKNNDNKARARYYLNGRKLSGRRHEGYLALHAAMRRIDPTVEIGAILGPEASWSGYVDWNKVIIDGTKKLAGRFYTFHGYSGAYDDAGALALPQRGVLSSIDGLQRRLTAAGVGEATLFNSEWHPYEPIRIGSIQMVAALAVADTIGVMIERGVHGQCFYMPVDTIWRDEHGTITGTYATMVRSYEANTWGRPTGFRWPDYYAFTMFTGAAGHALPVTCASDRASDLAAYAMQCRDGLQVVVINKRPEAREVCIVLSRLGTPTATARVDEVYPGNGRLDDQDVVFNQTAMSTPEAQGMDDLSKLAPAAIIAVVGGRVVYKVKAWSITRLRIVTGGGAR